MARSTAKLQRWGAERLEALGAPQAGPVVSGAPPEPTVLLLLDRGTADDRRLERVLAATAALHPDRLQVAAAPADAVAARLRALQDGRRAFDSFDFDRWPAVAVLRGGRLVTTFHPRRVFFPEALQEREEREQVEIFLSKMVYYDPAKVKEQKSLELEAGA